jgi:4-amino-4-deoxy-L-arabinose transferase-like glycosyltransferase
VSEPGGRRARIWLAAVLGVGAALRLGWVAFATRVPEGRHDPARYLLHALDLSEGRGYEIPQDGTPTAYYPVGYPFALSLVFRGVGVFHAPEHAPTRKLMAAAWRDRLAVHGDSLVHLVWAGTLFNAALGIASVALVFWIARRLAGTGAAALAAALTAAFPNLVFHTGVLMTETLFVFLLLASLALLLAAPWRDGEPRPLRLLTFGLGVGAAALVRPPVLVLLPALPLALLAGRLGWRRATGATLLAGLGAALVVAPWSVRNLLVMGAPIAISTNVGDNLCVGHYPGAPGHFVITPVCRGSRPYGKPVVNPQWEVERSAELRRKALRFAWQNRADEPALLLRKLYFTLWHDHNGLAASESHGKDPFLGDRLRRGLAVAADGYYYGVLALALPGLLWMVRRPWEPRRILLVLAVLGLVGAPLPFFGNPRFHVPILPLLCIAAGLTISALAQAWRGRASRTG